MVSSVGKMNPKNHLISNIDDIMNENVMANECWARFEPDNPELAPILLDRTYTIGFGFRSS